MSQSRLTRPPGSLARRRMSAFFGICAVAMAPKALALGSWTTGGPPLPNVSALAASPGSGSLAYAAAFNASGSTAVFKTTDGGLTWQPTALTGFGVGALAVTSDGTIYAGGDSVLRSSDGGATWSQFAGPVPGNATSMLVVDPRFPQRLFRGAHALIGYEITTGVLLRTLDGGSTWTSIDPTAVAPLALALDPRQANVLYVGSGGLYRSADIGSSWAPTGLAYPPTAIVVDPFLSGTLYAATNSGVFKSVDDGVSFEAVGLSAKIVSSLVIDPLGTGRLYAAVYGEGVFSSIDGGTTWTPLNNGLTDLGVYQLVVNSSGTQLHAATTTGVFDYQIGSAACLPDETTACLQEGRFRVSVAWSAPSGQSGPGRRLGVTGNTTGFWFFDPTNVEVVVKVLDGRQINGKWWVFYGALSNVEYSITVTDTQTGATRTYFNPQGQLASFADTSAF
jgi:photosystem II stability/assembly factor-like uncharacterized protein